MYCTPLHYQHRLGVRSAASCPALRTLRRCLTRVSARGTASMVRLVFSVHKTVSLIKSRTLSRREAAVGVDRYLVLTQKRYRRRRTAAGPLIIVLTQRSWLAKAENLRSRTAQANAIATVASRRRRPRTEVIFVRVTSWCKVTRTRSARRRHSFWVKISYGASEHSCRKLSVMSLHICQ